MALGDPYATQSELKGYMGDSESTDNAKYDDALSAASRGIDHYCQRQFNKTTSATARVYYPANCRYVEVDDFHTITDLVVKYDTGDAGTYATTVTSANYQLLPLNGIVQGESGWPYNAFKFQALDVPVATVRPSVQITAQWGWNAVPGPVKQACLLLAAEAFKLAREAPFGVAGFGAFGAVRVRDNPRAMSMLNPYRRSAVLVA
jgi:hypothetical protein